MATIRDVIHLLAVMCTCWHVTNGLSCDPYRGSSQVTCSLSAWVCGQKQSGWETRTLKLKYADGRSSSRWESRSPCTGGSSGSSSGGGGGGGCADTVASSTCVYWKDNYGCDHPYVEPRCCKTCQGEKEEPEPVVPEPSGGGGGGSTGGSGDQGACVNDANKYRGLHRNTPSLSGDSRLTTLAQRWADTLLSKMITDIRAGRSPRLQHDPNNRKYKTGENVYYANTYEQGGIETFCKKADKSWYSEIKDYSFSSHRSTGGVTGHFTQMVWVGSKKVGYGYAAQQHPKYPSNRVIIVVAKYSPPGNYRGEYANNVMPRK